MSQVQAETMFGASKEKRFWKWFEKNEDRLFNFEKFQDAIFAELGRRMTAVDPNLTFEFSPVLEDGQREFVISAEGIKASFPAVEALAAEAPELPRWTWIKYRPRRGFSHSLRINQRKTSSDEVRYAMVKDGDLVGVLLFFDGYEEDDKMTFKHFAFLFLDHFLGEYDVATRVGLIEVFPNESEYYVDSRPLANLPEQFDAHYAEQKKSYH